MTFYVNDIEIIVQVDARSKHYLIETEDNNDEKDNKDDTADERFNMASPNRKAPDPNCLTDDCVKQLHYCWNRKSEPNCMTDDCVEEQHNCGWE